jgi:DNA invertase Pin-like site-specific DNA recombinase
VAKLDRLARNLHFVTNLQAANVDFICCDMPTVNRLTIHIIAAIAENKAQLISTRTKQALAEKKKQGIKLGNPQNNDFKTRRGCDFDITAVKRLYGRYNFV